MDNVEKIRDKLKDFPELLKSFNMIIDKPRERNEIYIYCLKRQTYTNKIHYIPLLTFWDGERKVMACNDLKNLQEEYEQELIMYKLYGYPISIIEISFGKYLELCIDLEKYLNNFPYQESFYEDIKRLKTEALFSNIELNNETIPLNTLNAILNENNYCKCLDENLNIVECLNYKPVVPFSYLDDGC